VNVDSRAKAGSFGEKVKGPHKPTLDEMGPHAMLPVPSGKKTVSDPLGLTPRGTSQQGVRPGGSDTPPTRTIEVPTDKEKKGRRGRPRKTGRPGH
jgi:excinuclease ABC subunit B